ncbi:2-succinyl-5-enolpyruvyl-6-hydroxy-3-cyclohexene-1-carboxylic-acid synthase [Allonocardiopsis opalescens]|uniref:2-succinyl-5-enolpyruvyl-6-hydroxy-3-cyclohexene-1-carboxylate synthase n=1 Tax=Allonocardiopsis opalescens TaxID=1144618 RepID=A0A2T0Q4V5_9ACTN|nr:2-succinyl-5-enolpyruvyl-6-hydroxy-3-cyclohexene-1-carboxylic-acid synthase [Allonocardiopsis opalescens]PRX98779.1 2-succinyl-5-enolpyruvyl-6-hydroxy-3-cyclohexene-1-carboxylate synthase [Allonocardiopsis opalescens]
MNPSTALARVLADELARLGLREAVIAPGSRSTPLAMALAAHPRVRVHVRIDERSAAFCALGLARASGRPAAVVCTSGTAAANLHPAAVEAGQAGVGLLLLTADRPPELRDTGANQAVDQIRMFGSAVRWFSEVGVPEERPGMVGYWRSLAGRAWGWAAGADPGPVHLNIALRDPLVPDGDPSWVEPLDGRPGGAPWTAPEPVPEAAAVELPAVERGVLVCGDTGEDPAPFVAAAHAAGWPVLAEPTGNARYGPAAVGSYRHLLAVAEFAAAHRPEAVVTLGRVGLSRQVLAYLRTAGVHVACGGGPRYADPVRTAASVGAGRARVVVPGRRRGSGAWLASWQRADAAARAAVDAELDAGGLSEPRLARDLVAALPEGSLLVAGSSMPVRDLDGYARPRTGVRVIGNRGASGIDGLVSTAVGAALAHQAAGGGRAFALLGDLTLLHDQNGLLLGPGEERPDLVVVVANNDGGGIFSTLEQAEHPQVFERLFGTPHGVGADRVAAMAGWPHLLLDHPKQLPDALAEPGPRLVEARTDRVGQAALRARVQQAVAAAVRDME